MCLYASFYDQVFDHNGHWTNLTKVKHTCCFRYEVDLVCFDWMFIHVQLDMSNMTKVFVVFVDA